MRDHESSLPVGEITFTDRLRQLNRETVETLKQSIRRLGLKVPISVRFISDEEGYAGVAGLHRFVACQELGWTSVPVREETGTADDARMWEIAENLHRAELTALERSEHIAEWVRLSDIQTAQVAPNESKRSDGRGHRPEGGINAAARELGIDRTEAQRAVKVAENLVPEAKEEARVLGLDDNQSALLKAAAEPTPEAQQQSLQEHAAKLQKPRAPKAKPAAEPAAEARTVAPPQQQPEPNGNGGDSDEVVWRRGLLERAGEAVVMATFESSWAEIYKIDRQLVDAAEQASRKWNDLAVFLKRSLGDLQPANPAAGDPPAPESKSADVTMPVNDDMAESAIEGDPLTALQKQYTKLSDRSGASGWIMRRLGLGEEPGEDDKSEVAEFIRRFMAVPKPIQNQFRAGLIGEQPVGAGVR